MNKFKDKIHFSSKIYKNYYNDLEKLLFFNQNQSKYYGTIKKVIEDYGEPKIFFDEQYIKVTVDGLTNTKCLFASLGPKLVGIAIYSKIKKDTISILHIAVDHKYSFIETDKKCNVLMKILSKIKIIARQIKEVKYIEIYYKKKPLKINI